jgi:uncharacterized protein (UPF0335 family)
MSFMRDNTETGNERLKYFIARIEHFNEVKFKANRDVAELYKEAKSEGFKKAAIQAVVKERAMDPKQFEELEATIALYRKEAGSKKTHKDDVRRGASDSSPFDMSEPWEM